MTVRTPPYAVVYIDDGKAIATCGGCAMRVERNWAFCGECGSRILWPSIGGVQPFADAMRAYARGMASSEKSVRDAAEALAEAFREVTR